MKRTCTSLGCDVLRPIPDFVIAGAQKCGTTSLYYWLGKHPNVFTPRIKEPNYFSTFDPVPLVRRGIPIIRDRDQYDILYKEAKSEQLRGDASVSYLWDQNAAQRIRDASPSCRIIILVRDPVDRAYSAYLMWKAGGVEKRTFDQAIIDELKTKNQSWEKSFLYIELSRYGYQVERYLNVFPREQILIMSSRELLFNPRQSMINIAIFLNLDGNFWRTFDFENFNTGGEPRGKISERILASHNSRAFSRLLIPKNIRLWIAGNILIRKGITSKPSISARKIIWSECGKDILKLELLAQRKYADLWFSYAR